MGNSIEVKVHRSFIPYNISDVEAASLLEGTIMRVLFGKDDANSLFLREKMSYIKENADTVSDYTYSLIDILSEAGCIFEEEDDGSINIFTLETVDKDTCEKYLYLNS